MARRKLSRAQVWRLFSVSLMIGMGVGIYYLLSPYQQCRREMLIDNPNVKEAIIIDECMKRTAN